MPSPLSNRLNDIQGIHNVFVVIPQFLVTGMSSIIFAIFEPDKSVLHGHHPGKIPLNGTAVDNANAANATMASTNATLLNLLPREDEVVAAEGVNSVAIIFRIGGVAAAVACVLSWRLSKELRHR